MVLGGVDGLFGPIVFGPGSRRQPAELLGWRALNRGHDPSVAHAHPNRNTELGFGQLERGWAGSVRARIDGVSTTISDDLRPVSGTGTRRETTLTSGELMARYICKRLL